MKKADLKCEGTGTGWGKGSREGEAGAWTC